MESFRTPTCAATSSTETHRSATRLAIGGDVDDMCGRTLARTLDVDNSRSKSGKTGNESYTGSSGHSRSERRAVLRAHAARLGPARTTVVASVLALLRFAEPLPLQLVEETLLFQL